MGLANETVPLKQTHEQKHHPSNETKHEGSAKRTC